MTPDADTLEYSSQELCEKIEELTYSVMAFWKHSKGWAPMEASNFLDRSMLDWQASLATSLRRWVNASSQGDLILAWANLGALVEGQLKLFLTVYYLNYKMDADAIFKRDKFVTPDKCQLEPLRVFFVNRIWNADTNWNSYVQTVQQRRNAIHAFRYRDIGAFSDWHSALPLHLSFIRDTSGRLPYPDGYSIPL